MEDNRVMKIKDSWQSYAGILILALALPLMLRGINQIQRIWAGAEGRLAAINVQTDQVVGPLPAHGKRLPKVVMN